MDQRVKLTLRDAVKQPAHFIFLSGNLKLHAPIRQVANPAGYIKALCCMTHGPAKPDALNVPLIENLERNHRPAVKLLMFIT
jgi:hypothetical protein